jgi:flavin reductase (DIM6/NTAB) family NADH-FMN oxidoreductase RutF
VSVGREAPLQSEGAPRLLAGAAGLSLAGLGPAAAATVDEATVRAVHRQFVTGVTVVTTGIGGVPRGLAVNAFASVSLTPPLVLVCVSASSNTHEHLFRSEHFAINMLAADQAHIARRFASKEPDKFATLDWRPGPGGSPILAGSSAHLEAAVCERIRASTHTVFVGEVVAAEAFDRPPLVYMAGEMYDPERLVALA